MKPDHSSQFVATLSETLDALAAPIEALRATAIARPELALGELVRGLVAGAALRELASNHGLASGDIEPLQARAVRAMEASAPMASALDRVALATLLATLRADLERIATLVEPLRAVEDADPERARNPVSPWLRPLLALRPRVGVPFRLVDDDVALLRGAIHDDLVDARRWVGVEPPVDRLRRLGLLVARDGDAPSSVVRVGLTAIGRTYLALLAELDSAPRLAPSPPDNQSTPIAEQVAALVVWLLHLCRAFPPSTTGRFANLEVD